MARPRFVCLLLALITLLVYLPVRRHEFLVYDDPDYVTENRMVQAGLSAPGVQWAFTTFHASNWHPLTWLSHMFDCRWFGLEPGPQHLINVLIHAANAVLLFLLLLRATGRLWPAAIVAALFAWHPLHVESVAWIAERKDVLSTFFGLSALLAYTSYTTHKTYRTYAVCLALFALGLLCKPMLVTLPFVMLLLDYWPLKRVSGATYQVSGALILEKLPFFLLALVSCVLTILAQRTEAIVGFEQHSLGARLANAPVAASGYLLKTVWPVDLAVVYPLAKHLPPIHVAIAALALLLISAAVWLARRRSPYLLSGWLWFIGMLVPVIGLVQVGGQSMADRYTYLPLIGIFIMIAYGGEEFLPRFRQGRLVAAVATALALAACLALTARQLRYWQDSEQLFTRAIAVTGANDIAEINLGVAVEQAGRTEDAMRHYAEALRINPNSAQAHNNLANLLANGGKREEALTHYREAVRLKPKAPLVHENFGTLLVETGAFDEALEHYREAARLAPDSPRPHYLMGKARLRQGRSADGGAHFREALRRDPNDLQTLAWLARVLAADEDPRVRNGAEAVALASRANELTGGEQSYYLDLFAMACAEAGRFDEAEKNLQKAIDRATAAGMKEPIPAMQQRLKLYQSKQPYRERFANP